MDPRIHPGSDGRFRIWNDKKSNWTVYETEAEAVRALPKGRAPKTDSGPMFTKPVVDMRPIDVAALERERQREKDAKDARRRARWDAEERKLDAKRERFDASFRKALSGRFVSIDRVDPRRSSDASAVLVILSEHGDWKPLVRLNHYDGAGWQFSRDFSLTSVWHMPETWRARARAAVHDLTHRGAVKDDVAFLDVEREHLQSLDAALNAAHAHRRQRDEEARLREEKFARVMREADEQRRATEENHKPHIKEFSDGFRVWSPALERYLQDGLRGAFATREAAQGKLAEVLAGGRRAPRAGAAPSLFAEAPRKGEQVGLFRQNPRRPVHSQRASASRPNPSPGRPRPYYTASAVNARTGVRETVEQIDATMARRLYGKSVERALHQRWKELAAKSSTTGLVVNTADGRRYTASSLTVERVKVTVI